MIDPRTVKASRELDQAIHKHVMNLEGEPPLYSTDDGEAMRLGAQFGVDGFADIKEIPAPTVALANVPGELSNPNAGFVALRMSDGRDALMASFGGGEMFVAKADTLALAMARGVLLRYRKYKQEPSDTQS